MLHPNAPTYHRESQHSSRMNYPSGAPFAGSAASSSYHAYYHYYQQHGYAPHHQAYHHPAAAASHPSWPGSSYGGHSSAAQDEPFDYDLLRRIDDELRDPPAMRQQQQQQQQHVAGPTWGDVPYAELPYDTSQFQPPSNDGGLRFTCRLGSSSNLDDLATCALAAERGVVDHGSSGATSTPNNSTSSSSQLERLRNELAAPPAHQRARGRRTAPELSIAASPPPPAAPRQPRATRGRASARLDASPSPPPAREAPRKRRATADSEAEASQSNEASRKRRSTRGATESGFEASPPHYSRAAEPEPEVAVTVEVPRTRRATRASTAAAAAAAALGEGSPDSPEASRTEASPPPRRVEASPAPSSEAPRGRRAARSSSAVVDSDDEDSLDDYSDGGDGGSSIGSDLTDISDSDDDFKPSSTKKQSSVKKQSPTKKPAPKKKSDADRLFVCPTLGCGKRYTMASALSRHRASKVCNQDAIPVEVVLRTLIASELRPVDTPVAVSKEQTTKSPLLYTCQVGNCFKRYTSITGLLRHYETSSAHGWLGQALLDVAGKESARICPYTNRAVVRLFMLNPTLQHLVVQRTESYARAAQRPTTAAAAAAAFAPPQ